MYMTIKIEKITRAIADYLNKQEEKKLIEECLFIYQNEVKI